MSNLSEVLGSYSASYSGINFPDQSYQKALSTLLNLEPMAKARQLAIENRCNNVKSVTIENAIKYLQRIGVSLPDVDSLNVIHVSGTKGKGSTCAFTESILRHSGRKTRLYTSPHLVTTREKIRINGQPLSEADFAKYFVIVYERLVEKMECLTDKPPQFMFLTCMSYYVFLQENVDLAIVEVGLGGLFCSTNLVRKPIAVGIASLGLDHQDILGDTLEEIAKSKSGIMKNGVPAFTVHTQPDHILEYFRRNAEEGKCTFYIAPPLDSYKDNKLIKLGIDGDVSRLNAGLALQLANTFLTTKCQSEALDEDAKADRHGFPFTMLKLHTQGLQNCNYAGRFQKIQLKPNLTYYLDGAHTEKSLIIARNWFLENTNGKGHFRVLVFYVSGGRDGLKLLKLFSDCQRFHLAIFCPLVISNCTLTPDSWAYANSSEDDGGDGMKLMKKCRQLQKFWNERPCISVGITEQHLSMALSIRTVNDVQDYLGNINLNNEFNNQNYKHITGSLHLMASFLTILPAVVGGNS